MIKRLCKSIREYKKNTIQAPVFVFFEVVMEIIIPLLMAKLIDDGIKKGDMNVVLICGALLIVAAGISLTFGILAGKAAAKASCGFAKNLRKDMYYNIQNFSFKNIDDFSTSSLVTRLTTDVTNVQMAFQMIIRIAIRSPFLLIFSFCAAMYINVDLSLIFVVVIPVLAIGLFLIMRLVFPIFNRVFKTYDKLNNDVEENLRGIRVVKSFTREDYEVNKFEKTSKKIYDDFSKAERILVFNMPLMQFSIYTCMIFISWFGAQIIVNTKGVALETGQLTSMFTYTMQILMSLMMLSMVFVMITISKASAKRIVEVLEANSDIELSDNPVKEVKSGSIDFNNVDFSYSKRPDNLCLKKIDLHIKSGETIGIIGGTGSAKSSLISLIPRLYDTVSGDVLVGGVNVKNYDLEALRKQVAVVLQKNVLFSGTIKENLLWGKEDATIEEMKNACKLAQADSFIEGFPLKYDTFIEQGGTNVSGGQRQRLCIARALLMNPKIIILDDSTSAVDTKTDSLIREAFKSYIPDTTKLIIAQRVASVMDADKIIVMDNGEIKAVGNHEELLASSNIYREVYESQIKGDDSND